VRSEDGFASAGTADLDDSQASGAVCVRRHAPVRARSGRASLACVLLALLGGCAIQPRDDLALPNVGGVRAAGGDTGARGIHPLNLAHSALASLCRDRAASVALCLSLPRRDDAPFSSFVRFDALMEIGIRIPTSQRL